MFAYKGAGRHRSLQRPPTARSSPASFDLKLPTSKFDVANSDGDLAERSLQLGSGTTDVILGGYFRQVSAVAQSSWFVQTQGQWASHTRVRRAGCRGYRRSLCRRCARYQLRGYAAVRMLDATPRFWEALRMAGLPAAWLRRQACSAHAWMPMRRKGILGPPPGPHIRSTASLLIAARATASGGSWLRGPAT